MLFIARTECSDAAFLPTVRGTGPVIIVSLSGADFRRILSVDSVTTDLHVVSKKWRNA